MRKTKMLKGEIHSFWVRGQRNPCGCGSNCYHLEDDGKTTFGVCNACKMDIYQVKRDMKGDWK